MENVEKESVLKRIILFVKKRYKYLLFCVLCFGFCCLSLFSDQHDISNKKMFIAAIPSFLFVLTVSLVFWLKEKKGYPIRKIFLFVTPIIGLSYIVIMPLSMPPDETNHFRRAYEISEGHLLSDHDENGMGGRVLPESISLAFNGISTYSELPKNYDAAGQSVTETFQEFSNTSLYSPLSYFPQIIGIWVGKLLHLPIFCMAYLARLFNFAFWMFLIYLALKWIPFGHAALFLIILSPISLQSSTSCQADALVNASTLAFFAFVLHKIKEPKTLTKKELGLILCLIIVIALCKIVYLPFCFLVCLIPKQCFGNAKDKIIKISLFLTVAIGLNLLWLFFSSHYLIEFNPGVNSLEQVKYILSHPLSYITTIFRTFTSRGMFFFTSGLGANLGHLNINLSSFCILLFGFYFLYTYLREPTYNFRLGASRKIFLGLMVLACVLLICTSLYVQWTAVASPEVEGIQGRYFLPIIPLMAFLINPVATHNSSLDPAYPITFGLTINAYALTTIAIQYLV